MQYYGNILTLYSSTSAQLATVKKRITDLGFPFELIESTFFFGTSSIKKSRDFQKELLDMPIVFTFFFLSNSDGSTINGKGVSDETVNHIDGIFFDDI